MTLLFLLITGIVKAYDFSEVCPSGQTLYYTIEDEINYYVSVLGELGKEPKNGGFETILSLRM